MAPTIGRIVNAVIQDKYGALATRPAIVVRVWMETLINVQVFCDGDNTVSPDGHPNVLWEQYLTYNESADQNRTWHWPKRD